MNSQSELDLKKQYAFLMLNPEYNDFQAALKLFPGDTALALKVSMEWPIDKQVLNFKEEILNTVKDHTELLPTAYQALSLLWEKIKVERDSNEYNKLMRTYLEGIGAINKGRESSKETVDVDVMDEIKKFLKA